ncbi:hypothetical protein [Kyrpidia spormannii]|uniref:hypothetical protein n=1 Tax=Kyrpidia spormannii TaxID=2055160 RepID=UPI001475F99D|nr:hypothetical protein [Kyrpidia spormannii]
MEFYVFHRYDKSGYEPTWTGLQCYSEVKQAEVDDVLFALERSQRQWGALSPFSVLERVGGECFLRSPGPHGMSDVFKHFGQLTHAHALCALANPSINSYRRLRPYTFAPSNITWGFENRMCLIRAPHVRGQGTHLENRLPGADHNPYLMIAAMFAAGLDGIRNRTPFRIRW